VLLQKHKPERAQLGLKAIHNSLPAEITNKIRDFYNQNTSNQHPKAVKNIVIIKKDELE
jgi:hypothetical protein